MGRLDGRSILVTGGGSGLGRALVTRFVAEGARVLAFDRAPDRLASLETAHPGTVVTVTGDVTVPADNAAAVETAVAAFGSLDVFVGNAGLWDFSRSVFDASPEDVAHGFDELFAVNVKGYLLGARAAVEALRSARGSMIFTLSNASFFPGGGGVLYTASKHAGVGLVRQMAYELAPDVRVNGVAPGGMATDLSGPGSLGLSEQTISTAFPINEVMEKHSSLQRVNTAEEYAGAYVLLATADDAPTVTGTVFDVSSFGTPVRPAL